jgi:hypothetical protein
MYKTPARSDQLETADLLVLVANLIAARHSDNRPLETAARQELKQLYGITLHIARGAELKPCRPRAKTKPARLSRRQATHRAFRCPRWLRSAISLVPQLARFLCRLFILGENG